MSIFIPVLFVCMNGHCEFMQQHEYYKSDEACRKVVQIKKGEMTAKFGPKIEATCIEANIKERQA